MILGYPAGTPGLMVRSAKRVSNHGVACVNVDGSRLREAALRRLTVAN
jgi:hypothetical protein